MRKGGWAGRERAWWRHRGTRGWAAQRMVSWHHKWHHMHSLPPQPPSPPTTSCLPCPGKLTCPCCSCDLKQSPPSHGLHRLSKQLLTYIEFDHVGGSNDPAHEQSAHTHAAGMGGQRGRQAVRQTRGWVEIGVAKLPINMHGMLCESACKHLSHLVRLDMGDAQASPNNDSSCSLLHVPHDPAVRMTFRSGYSEASRHYK